MIETVLTREKNCMCLLHRKSTIYATFTNILYNIFNFFIFIYFWQVCFLDNTILMVFWWIAVSDKPSPRPWFIYPAIIGQIGSFALSIALLGFYYKSLHANLTAQFRYMQQEWNNFVLEWYPTSYYQWCSFPSH